jgi:hypothetical protein
MFTVTRSRPHLASLLFLVRPDDAPSSLVVPLRINLFVGSMARKPRHHSLRLLILSYIGLLDILQHGHNSCVALPGLHVEGDLIQTLFSMNAYAIRREFSPSQSSDLQT